MIGIEDGGGCRFRKSAKKLDSGAFARHLQRVGLSLGVAAGDDHHAWPEAIGKPRHGLEVRPIWSDGNGAIEIESSRFFQPSLRHIEHPHLLGAL